MNLAIYISAETEAFEEIGVRGRVLGVSPKTRYSQQEIPIYLDDLIIILLMVLQRHVM